MKKMIGFFKDERGATAVEYGLMVAAIAGALLVIAFTLGNDISALFQSIVDKI